MPSVRPYPPPQPDNGQGWFSGVGSWFPSFSWGSSDNPAPQNPPLQSASPQPGPGTGYPQPAPPAPPPMPQPPQQVNGSGTETAWGGPPSPEASSATIDPASIPTADTKKYSFLDNPGASDALVAFGAAMLKAPDFNSGLGDAALAVNKVAQQYRPLSENDWSRARQLGMLERIKSGKGVNPGGTSVNRDILYRDKDGNTWFDAVGPNGEAGLFNQDTGQFTTGQVPGLTRDVYDYGSNRSRRSATKDADIEAEFASKIPSAAQAAQQFDQLYRLAADDKTGIDTSFTTRVKRQLETLLPGSGLTDLDPNNITEFNNRLQNVALQYSQNMLKGQGQVTENERAMIERAVGQPGSMTKQSAMLVFKIMRDAELRKLHMYQEWTKSPELRDSYGGSFAAYQAEVMIRAADDQINGGNSGGSAHSGNSGGRKSLNDIFGP